METIKKFWPLIVIAVLAVIIYFAAKRNAAMLS